MFSIGWKRLLFCDILFRKWGLHIFGFFLSHDFDRVPRFHSVGFGEDITNLRGIYEATRVLTAHRDDVRWPNTFENRAFIG